MTNYYLLINDELRVTPNHPVYVSGRWIKAEELRVGDVFGGNTIYSIERIYQRVPTYNFEVEPYHTYIIIWGENAGSVVHNANATTQLNETQVKVKKILIKAGVSADKYYSPSVKADAGVKTKVEVSKKVVTNSTKKIVIKNVVHVIPKTYENKKGEKVRVDDISVVVNESGEYSVQKKQQSGKVVTVKTGLKSSQEVVNYIEKSIVNKDSSTSHQNSNGNNNNVNDDEDINDDEDTCCFPAGTMITMADGSLKPIEDVRVGDSVLSYDVKNQRTTVCRVLEKVAPVRAGVYSINNGLVYVTDDHPFYTLKRDGRVGWAAINPEHTEYGYSMSVLPLKVGDKLFTQKGEWVTVNSIVYEPGPIQTYNLEDVSGKSTFFANGLLVHNAVQCKDSHDSRGVLYGYHKEVSTVVLSDEPLSFEGENDLDVWLAIEVPIEFNGSGSYIADDDKEFNGSRGYVADDDKSVNSGKTAGGSGVLPSTKIVMADGSTKCIHSIKVGDLVRSYDPPSRRTVNARVTQVCKYAGDEMGEYYLIIKFKSKVPYTQKQFYIRQGDDGKEKVIHSLILSPLLHGMKFSTDGTSPRIIERRYRDSVEGVAVGELRLTPTHLVYVKTAPGEYKLVAAASVKTGYTLVGMHGELVVSSVQKVFKKSVTYSVKLDRYGAYFANGVLVQNIDVSADARLAIADDDKQQKPEPMDVDDNEIAVYIWDFGDGTIGYGENPRHIYHVDVPFVPLTAGDVKEVELCGALYEGSTNGLRDVDIKKTPTGIRTSRDPWVPGQPTVDRKPVEDDNRVTSTIQPTYVTRKVTYPVTLVVIDKYGRIGVDTTEITITVPVPTQPIQDGYLSDVYYKSIEDVKVGDWVKTVDLKSKKFVNARVTEVMHHTASEMNSCYLAIRFKPALPRFELDRGSVPTKKCESVDTIMDRDYMLEVTPNHLICVVPPSASSVNNIAYKWVSAGSLKVGDVTYSVTGEKIVVSSIEKVYRRVDTYNIKVESYGTYFANGILVQDKTSPEIPVSSVCFLAGTQIMMAKNPYVAKNPYEEKEIKDDPHLTRLDELFSQLILQSF
ncbi:MAG TPA: hypothetical protein EYP23_07060 [Thermoplasmata archaeon]|nr:hypothetical protein [Thermoplasmata archaeon]